MRKKYLDDYELIYLISQGDDRALEELIRKYKITMQYALEEYKHLLKDKFDAKELYQISLISLYRAILTYNENMECSFYTYLRIVIHRDILSYVRTLTRDRNKANLYAVSLDQNVKESEGLYLIDMVENNHKEYNPKDYLNTKELGILIKQQLDTFKEEEKEVFILWYAGYHYEEIIQITGLPMHKVSYIIAKIKKKLKGSIDYKEAL